MLIELSKGVAFLLALCFIQGFIARRWTHGEPIGQLLSGLLFGGICVIGMTTPVVIAPGVIFDARSVVLSMAGLFGGPVGGGIAAVIAGGYRLWLGGAGAPVGIAVVVACVLLGLAYRDCHRRGWVRIGIPQLLAFGLIVHLVVIFLFTFLPAGVAEKVMDSISVPMVLTFTPATALLGILLHSINVQIQTTNALTESERRFKDIAESTSDWIWEMGPDLRFTYFSHRHNDAMSYDPTRRIGSKREDAVPQFELDENTRKWDGHFADLEARRSFRNFEYVANATEDGLRYVRISGTPVFAPDGTFQGYRGTGSDITVEKTAEKALRESEEHYRGLFDGLEVGIQVGTLKRGRVFANRACAELFGYDTVDALMQAPPTGLIAEQDRERASKYTRDLYAGLYDSAHYEVDGQHKDGSRIPIQAFARRILWDGETAILRTFIDLTDRKRAEEQLRQAQKMEAVGQLTGGVAHDFNNILTAVTGNLEMAAKLVDRKGDTGTLINRALAAAWRAAGLTDRLLAFSRKQALIPQVINARDLVAGMTDLLQRTVEESISIECRGAPDLWMCEVDPNQLESAILNLAINARDAMPDGGALSIETRNASLDNSDDAARADVTPGNYVVVVVTDTGTGMAQEIAEKAFDPFFTSKDVGKGSGLGLSMVYGFVNQSGGHVTIDSEEGAGTTVKLYLPRSEALADELRPATLTELPESHGETILIVEDDPDVRALSVTLLSHLGYKVMEAADSRSALSILEKAPRIDLLFTDVVLPGGMKGPDLAAEFMRRQPDIAVLYTSGYMEDAVIHHGRLDGGVELLNKPFHLEDLAQKVRAVIDKSRR